MLLLPAIRKIQSLTVFADDEVWYRFYLVPEAPAIRKDENDKPVFLLVKYAFDDASRAQKPDLPTGGGYVSFDVAFTPSEAERSEAKKELQKWVDAEFARRKLDPAFSGKPEYQAAKAPEVVFADPTWSRGHVKMLAPQSESLVTGRVAEEPASLVSSNIAVFNMDLSPPGATFMQKTLVGQDGRGATDLTPVQIVYELAFWGRLPPVTIHIEADSSRVYQALAETSEKLGDDPCTPSTVEDYRKRGTTSQTLEQTGAVKVTIKKDDASLSDEALEALRKFAFDLFDTMLKDRFLVPEEVEEPPTVEEPTEPLKPDEEPTWAAVLYKHANFSGPARTITGDVPDLRSIDFNDQISSLKVRKGDRVTLYRHVNYAGNAVTYTSDTAFVGDGNNDQFSSLRIYRSPTRKLRLVSKEVASRMTAHIELTLEQSRVVEWNIAPQGTLETFFQGMRASEIAQHVREIDLDDPFFQSLGLDITVFANFQSEPISFVDVDIDYRGPGADGREEVKTKTFTFTKSGEKQRWDPSLLGTVREYRYRYRIHYKGSDAISPFTPWAKDSRSQLNVAVNDPGKLDVSVFAANVSFDVVSTLSVALSYRGADASIPAVDQTLVLDKATRQASFTRYLFAPITGPVVVTPTFFLVSGQRLDGASFETRSAQVPIQMPFVDTLNVSVAPAGDFTDVTQVVVSLAYDDGAGFHEDKDIRFTSATEFATWNVLLRRPDRREFKYKSLILYKNAAPVSKDWTVAEGDQAIAIMVPAQPKLRVDIYTSLVDFKVTPVVSVAVTHHGLKETSQTFSFTAPGNATFLVPLAPGETARATYVVKYMPEGEEPVELAPEELPAVASTSVPVYVAPYKSKKPVSGKLKVTLLGNLIDFNKTALVQVALFYQDPDNEVDELGSVVLSKQDPMATWEIPTKNAKKRGFRYQVTYHFSDGTPSVEMPEVSTELPQVILQPHKP